MDSIQIGANTLSYDVNGAGDAIILMPGWCHDSRLFKNLMPELAKTHKVYRLDWRGHGYYRDEQDGEFGAVEQAEDVIAFLDKMGVEKFVPLSHAHGGWACLELLERVGPERAKQAFTLDWIHTEPSQDFITNISKITEFDTFHEGRNWLFDYWIGTSDNADVIHHCRKEMAGYSFDMWARSCRVIAEAYQTWGNPLERMKKLRPSRPIMQMYAQPADEAYHKVLRDYAAENPWFTPSILDGGTHFPSLEIPEQIADRVRQSWQ